MKTGYTLCQSQTISLIDVIVSQQNKSGCDEGHFLDALGFKECRISIRFASVVTFTVEYLLLYSAGSVDVGSECWVELLTEWIPKKKLWLWIACKCQTFVCAYNNSVDHIFDRKKEQVQIQSHKDLQEMDYGFLKRPKKMEFSWNTKTRDWKRQMEN